ncbi:imidazolonepropionase [Psychroflexus sp. ALD_RP9]|uniref:imidazolonepropionase n=1 Tax=Psychroflexus sp. ALD_RP9 TaxID=2777186 RepID=UPI001A8C0B1B|nr:imidazolonepropionase [Psychroflexus sp. ALD_RP9]QSS96872.1 imidazolonepropionase [Psychroflexus sp. ALD_RP9]
MRILFTHIKSLLQVRETKQVLVGAAFNKLPKIDEAWLLIEDQKIIDFGEMKSLPNLHFDQEMNCNGKFILPTWVDSHTHIVYSGNREQEFVDRIKGKTYTEIAQNGGGILNSAKTLQQTSFEELYQQSEVRLKEVIQLGTGAVEIKSGYGLTKEAELKMLKVIQKLKENYNLPIKASFLGAHAQPKEFKTSAEYISYVIQHILPEVAEQNLADYIDIFCEDGYFDLEDTKRIIKAGKQYGLKAKIHVNQFKSFGGIQLATKHNILSIDHLEVLTETDIQHLKKADTIAVALPSCSFYLGINYTPVKQLIDAEIPLALASDFNPGSTPSGNMNFVVSLACIKMKLTPEQAINAATVNAAFALELQDEVGSIAKGKKANFIVTKSIPSYGFLPYAFGTNSIDQVWINGKLQEHDI